MESKGRKIHGQAAQSRENGDFLKSLQLIDAALIAYQAENDLLGFSEALADRSITLRHLADITNNRSYRLLAKHEVQASIEIAEESGDKTALAIPYHNLGKLQSELNDFKAAAESHTKAVDYMINYAPISNNRAAIVADFKVHQAIAQYRAGDKSAEGSAEQALKDLEQVPVISDEQYEKQNKQLSFNEEVSYNKNVWLSGAHMHIAEMLKADNTQKAKEHLQKAKEIIDSDERLKLRKEQWEKLAQSFS